MPLCCIIFDCDGVIIESMEAKNAAFARLCGEVAPALRDEFTAYVSLHGGVSRYEKFAWLIRRAFSRDITPKESASMSERFVRYSLESVLASPLVPGFLDTAERWFGRVPLYVASGTPHHELAEVLKQKDLARYFRGILGTPPAKAALLRNILRAAQCAPEHAVMVGDSKTDEDAALINGTKFYGRGKRFASGRRPWGMDLTGLNAYLETLVAE